MGRLLLLAEDKKFLIKDIQRNCYEGIGKQEPLKGNLSGWRSRWIDDVNRIVTGGRKKQ